MSSETLDDLVGKLIENGIAMDMKLAVIEQATTPFQKVSSHPIYAFETEAKRDYVSPTLVIVGKVAALHETLKWMPENESADKIYFKPVTKNKEQEVRA